MDSPESQEIIAKYALVFPAVKDAIPTFLNAFTGKEPEHISVFIDETKHTGLWPIVEQWPQMNDIIQREFDLFWLGQYKTAEEEVRKVANQLQAIIGE